MKPSILLLALPILSGCTTASLQTKETLPIESNFQWAMVQSHTVQTAAKELTKEYFQPPAEYDPSKNPDFKDAWERYGDVRRLMGNMRMTLERSYFESSMNRHMHFNPEAFELELSKNEEYQRLSEESKLLRRQVAPYYDAQKEHENSYRDLAKKAIDEYSKKYDLVINETSRSNIHHSRQSERIDITESVIKYMKSTLTEGQNQTGDDNSE